VKEGGSYGGNQTPGSLGHGCRLTAASLVFEKYRLRGGKNN